MSQGQQLLHHKWMLADDLLVLGSANWTKAGFSANQDFFVVFRSLTPQQKQYFKKLCHVIDQESNDLIL
jgi:phosphatidylserine/phosphatidylglycerophosphate/cardiolipin synthase-like enzyme